MSFVFAENITPYLVDAKNIMVERRSTPISKVPLIGIGNKPIDGGYYLFTEKERDEFIEKEPLSRNLFKPWMGADELLHGYKRYCLYVKVCLPSELQKMPEVLKRIKLVKEYRLNSKSIPTQKLAKYPLNFHVTNIPKSDYISIPRTTSSKRKYIPIGFMNKNVTASSSICIIPNAKLYYFGVLSSTVHMAWTRSVCGRRGNDYGYSISIVYNNFIWPNPTPKQKEAIEMAVQTVLDARKLYPKSTLAYLYDPNTMPSELVKAHEKLDNTVKNAYGNKGFETEEEIVASLMKLYKEALDKENAEKKCVS